MPARGVPQECDLGATASADEETLLENGLTRPSTKQQLGWRAKMEGSARTEEDSRDPPGAVSAQGARGASPGPPPPWRPSLPQRRYLFPHVIHDAHEARQQFSFFSSSKFLLGLLLAALLHPGGCHPPSARFTPGAGRAERGVARSGHAAASVYQTARPGLRLQRPAAGAATAEGQGLAAPSETHREATSRARRRPDRTGAGPRSLRTSLAGAGALGREQGARPTRHSGAPLPATRCGPVVFVAVGRRRNFDFQRLQGRACPSVSPSQGLQI